MDIRFSNNEVEERIKNELAITLQSKRKRIFTKIIGAALGSIPWIGSYLNAMVDFKSEEGQFKNNQLYEEWLIEHNKKMQELRETIVKILNRLDEFPDEINERLESGDFMQLVRKAFRIWDTTDTSDKKELVRKLLTNAGSHKLVPDDLIRLFLDWINIYHEAHFAVIQVVYRNPGVTRREIWLAINGESKKENSMEADLFRLLIRDLSMGSVIRQHRATDYQGNFIKKTIKKSAVKTSIMKSAFDDNEKYELTELGEHFVHYTMNEVVPRIS